MRYTKIALLALLGLFSGCEEYYAEKDAEADGSKPYISISAPGQNSVYINNQPIKIESVLSDKDFFKEVEVQLVNLDSSTTSNQLVLNFKKFPKKNVFILDTTLTAANLPAGEYLLILNGIDGRTNVGTKEVNFVIK